MGLVAGCAHFGRRSVSKSMRRLGRFFIGAMIFAAALLFFSARILLAQAPADRGIARNATPPNLAVLQSKIPLVFEANRRQAASDVQFLSRSRAATLLFTENGLSWRWSEGTKGHKRRDQVLLAISGQRRRLKWQGTGQLKAHANYFWAGTAKTGQRMFHCIPRFARTTRA